MIFLNQHSKSTGQKCLILISLFVAITVSSFFVFSSGYRNLNFSDFDFSQASFLRQIILVSFVLIYPIRLFFTLFVFLKREMTWLEAFTVSIIMSSILFAHVIIGGSKKTPFNLIDISGLFLYIVDSYINTYSEYKRYLCKKKKENKKRLYTQGLFSYSRHINYFGDVILFTGLALITQEMRLLLIPFLWHWIL